MTSFLILQGNPGSGKTWTLQELYLLLREAGRRSGGYLLQARLRKTRTGSRLVGYDAVLLRTGQTLDLATVTDEACLLRGDACRTLLEAVESDLADPMVDVMLLDEIGGLLGQRQGTSSLGEEILAAVLETPKTINVLVFGAQRFPGAVNVRKGYRAWVLRSPHEERQVSIASTTFRVTADVLAASLTVSA